MRLLSLLLLALGSIPATAAAQPPTTVVSAAPDRVSVTVYRNPSRGRADAMNLGNLGGFGLVTETRTIRLPKGSAVLRFEGVAEGIVPVSAIVEGLPGGTVEKNRDARLLSPAALVDGSLGRVVTLTRTDPATGQMRREQATIVAGTDHGGRNVVVTGTNIRGVAPTGANLTVVDRVATVPGLSNFSPPPNNAGPSSGIILQTAMGIEALRCSGLPEALGFPTIPDGLSAKPVLSVSTVTPSEQTVTVTLSYLASGFDWSASYVIDLAEDGRSLDLFAWLTLANSNPESFADAEVQAVAGRLNRSRWDAIERRVSELRLICFPLGTTTSDLRLTVLSRDDILATGQTSVTQLLATIPEFSNFNALPNLRGTAAPPEDLGDLKLYRVPERVTVAPRGQKQVALLARSGVRFERRYRLEVDPGNTLAAAPTLIVLKLHNVKKDGLGLTLPAGTTTLYADRRGREGRLLVGTGTVMDHAEGQMLRISAGASSQVLVEQSSPEQGQSTLTITNANPFAIMAELPIGAAGDEIKAVGAKLVRLDGVATWTVDLPPNGRAELVYHHK